MAVAALLSLLFVAGVALALIPPSESVASSISTVDLRRLAVRFAGAALGGLLVLVVSGWVLPGLVIGLGAFWAIGNWQRRDRTNNVEIARLDALASWIENVRDVLMAGEQPVGAITSTAVPARRSSGRTSGASPPG